MSLNKEQYIKLCQSCDKILANDKSPKGTITISYLHIIRAHPMLLGLYQNLFIKKSVSFIQEVFNLVKLGAFSLIRIAQGLIYTKPYLKSQPIKKANVLFVSHLINNKHVCKVEDFYFGNLPEQLSQSNISCHITMLNHCSLRDEALLQEWKDNNIHKTVLAKNLSFIQEVKILGCQLKLFLGIKPKGEIERHAKLHSLSPATAGNMRVSMQIAQLIEHTQAQVIITTYEGHAWERLAYSEARKINPNIKCFAYQHVAIFEYQHAAMRPLQSIYNPDIILTSGHISKNILCDSMIGKHAKIVCVGSPKHIKHTQTTSHKQCCLVVPEGFSSECLALFELSLNYANENLDQQFIWRLHPIISFQELAKKSKLFKNIPDNITLSEQPLEVDIEQCDSVLYRGSTAVVGAINSGLKPIYYQSSLDELNIDPIYQKNKGKFIVHSQSELKHALEKNIDIETQQNLQKFAQDFYTPLNVKALLDLL